MSEIYASLPEVMDAYKNCNLLLPTATNVQISPLYKYHVELVPVRLEKDAEDTYWTNGGYALRKGLLNRLALAAGVQFIESGTYGTRIDRVTYRARAQGAIKRADGTWSRSEVDQKEICLEDEEEKFRADFIRKAAKGITDQKAAQDAADIFKGTWVTTTDKWGNQVNAFIVDESDRDRYVEHATRENMVLLKKTWAEKAMTGAKLRVIRALLGIKGSYTKSELSRPFAVPSVIFSPDYSDPEIRKMMIAQGMNSAANMFGSSQIPVRQMDVDDNVVYDADAESSVFASESDPEEADVTESVVQAASGSTPPDPAPTPVEPAYPERSRADDFQCSRCGAVINEKVYEYSINKFGEPLCFSCQKKGGRR